jgi:ParB family chromosome partitioning protein
MSIAQEIREIEVEKISINPFQPRRLFSQEELEDLAASIQRVGIIHPPVVRSKEEGLFELVSGERRFRAAQIAGLRKIPVLIREGSSAFSAEAALIENIQRVDLNPMEIAKALKSLSEKFSLSQDELAQRVGKKRSTVANYVRLLTLPPLIQDSVSKGLITMGHAKALLSVEGSEKQKALHDRTLREEWTVRQTEEAAQKMTSKIKASLPSLKPRDCHLADLAEKIQQKLGTKVTLQGTGKSGRICIDYYNWDDLDRLLDLLGVRGE